MRCGEKRFLVEYESQSDRAMVTILARTPAEARKEFRAAYGANCKVLSVITQNENYR